MTATKGFVVPAGGGKHLDMAAPGRFAAPRASFIYTVTATRSVVGPNPL